MRLKTCAAPRCGKEFVAPTGLEKTCCEACENMLPAQKTRRMGQIKRRRLVAASMPRQREANCENCGAAFCLRAGRRKQTAFCPACNPPSGKRRCRACLKVKPENAREFFHNVANNYFSLDCRSCSNALFRAHKDAASRGASRGQARAETLNKLKSGIQAEAICPPKFRNRAANAAAQNKKICVLCRQAKDHDLFFKANHSCKSCDADLYGAQERARQAGANMPAARARRRAAIIASATGLADGLKLCAKCKQKKPAENYSISSKGVARPRYFGSYCRACQKARYQQKNRAAAAAQ